MTRNFRIGTAIALTAISIGSYFITDALGINLSSPTPQQVAEGTFEREVAVPGTDHMSASTDDPEAKFGRWALRVYRAQSGDVCVQDGQLVGGRFGRMLSTGLVERGLDDTGTCAPSTAGSWAAVNRNPDDPRTSGVEPSRTVVFGLVEDGAARTVTVQTDKGATLTVPVDVDGGFIRVLTGTSKERSLTITLPKKDGAPESVQL